MLCFAHGLDFIEHPTSWTGTCGGHSRAYSTHAEGSADLQAPDYHQLHRPQRAAPRGWAGGPCWEHRWWQIRPLLHPRCRRPACLLPLLWSLPQLLHTGSWTVSNHLVSWVGPRHSCQNLTGTDHVWYETSL